ncbi:MAG: YlxR family protein [Deltaproteobacteria bacterium]|nr:YlxR family protein [Deltaproteobacteria bacterium]
MKKQPMRTCLGCQQRFPKKQLLKFVLQEGTVMLDRKGTEQGRSAYCCENNSCLRIFYRNKKKLSRAFRVQGCQVSVDWEDDNRE